MVSPAGIPGIVWVTIIVHSNNVILIVENTGETVTPQLVSTLVEPFQRGTERIHTDHEGVGLGLAIVKSITQAHDGTLTLTPEPSEGFVSPCNYPAHKRTPAHPDQADPPEPMWRASLGWAERTVIENEAPD